ncbi:MAG: site-2 protease family protein [Chloroflexi bacterium]|nr:site-2 protease family protein [Chloroflexota bacterium]
MPLPETDVLNSIIGRVFRYTDVTAGDPKQGFYLRYRGQLILDSAEAYEQLAEALRPYEIVPLFRKDRDGGHVIFLAPPPPKRKATAGISTNIVMFMLTLVSVMLTGAEIPAGTPIPPDLLGQLKLLAANFFSGWPFALALLSILLAHEFGHYIAGRSRKVDVSLPFFIPLPLISPLGTMGAFINLRSIPRNKRHLFDIGIAGPLAGLIVAIPVLLIGLSLSTTGTVLPVEGGYIEGNSLLYLLAKFAVFGQWLPAPQTYGAFSPLLYWLVYFFTGTPVPYGGVDVFIHPVALAGWAGLLVTSLNLIPAGQLDGGHILYTLFGDRLRKALPFIIAALVVMGFFWTGWWLWAGILFFFGRVHLEPLDQITELDPPRKALAWLMIIIFLLTITPVPMVLL